MEPFEMRFTLDADRVTPDGLCKLSTLLYFCQEAAGGHCAVLGLDWQTLAKRELFWALIRTRVEITRLPELGHTVTVKTWPMPTTRSAFPRAAAGYDEKGNQLFRCTSLWVLMHTKTRAMVLPGKSGVELAGITLGCELPAPGSLAPVEAQGSADRQVAPADLDRNKHMNNTRYMDWVWDYWQESCPDLGQPTGFTACYLSEALPGQKLSLSHSRKGTDNLCVEITRPREEDQKRAERIFAARVEFSGVL